MKYRIASILLPVIILFLPVISLGQEQRSGMPERNSIEWFRIDADFHTKPLLLKMLQFTAPYPGYYQQTGLNTDGTAFTARNVPNWAVQSSGHAILSDALLTQVKQMLAQIDFSPTPGFIEPEPNRLHTIFVFYNGHDYVRLNYNGPNPAQIDAIIALLNKEFRATERAREEEIAAHRKLMLESYGDWQNRPGITLNAGAMVNGCKGNRTLVVSVAGQRKPAASSSLVNVSLYHALVFYPMTAVLIGSGSGGRWSDDPVQSNVLIWRVPNGNGPLSEGNSKQVEVLHNAIDATITIANKTYRLADGNMFVIRVGADWQPTVTQLKEVFEEQATSHTSLNRFKALFKNDPSIQQLELY